MLVVVGAKVTSERDSGKAPWSSAGGLPHVGCKEGGWRYMPFGVHLEPDGAPCGPQASPDSGGAVPCPGVSAATLAHPEF